MSHLSYADPVIFLLARLQFRRTAGSVYFRVGNTETRYSSGPPDAEECKVIRHGVSEGRRALQHPTLTCAARGEVRPPHCPP